MAAEPPNRRLNNAANRKIYFFDDNVSNAYYVHTMGVDRIKEVVPAAANIAVEGVFWDPFKEEMEGDAKIAPHAGGGDFQLDGALEYPHFRDDHRAAVMEGVKQEKREHLAFFGLDVDELVRRFEAYLPMWEEDAKANGIKLGEKTGEAAKSDEEKAAERKALYAEEADEAAKALEALGLEETEDNEHFV